MGEKFELHTDAKGKLTQFFLEDPDGYWIEICDCGHVEEHHDKLVVVRKCTALGACGLAKMSIRARRWAHAAKRDLAEFRRYKGQLIEELAMLQAVSAEDVDHEKLTYLCLRRNTYGDPCQGFSEVELRSALAQSGNNVAGALLVLRCSRQASGAKVLMPPAFLDETGHLHSTRALQTTDLPIFD